MHVAVSHLLAWYKTHARDLPWRKTRDPYAIFISELMLQQTQVDRVIPKYLVWLERFPDWRSLARARTSDVILSWSGLGYNRRGLYAHDAAKRIVEHGLPRTLQGWRKIRGVGPYMAAALFEFALHQRAIVIDTNVRRVAGRVLIGSAFPKPEEDKKLILALDAATPMRGHHWIVPQAFMDFANMVCLARSPACATCPLRKQCKSSWYFLGTKKAVPLKKITRERIRLGKKYPDRIYRGRILKLLLSKKRLSLSKIGPRIDGAFKTKDLAWVRDMAGRLVMDGLLAWHGKDALTLPRA